MGSTLEMPGESGIDLTRHITSEHEDTAVIMLTAVDDPETADRPDGVAAS